MICDKCGFEHNNKSACPKCGARVIYVNEDYLKRRQEWEEAKKNGNADNALPPGIMHSTKEEHDAGGRKTVQQKEGGSEMTGLSFDKFKTWLVRVIAVIITFYNKHFKKKRGANNPVIRELKFDDSPETLDTSKLVVSHKIYKDKRKKIALFALAGVIVIALIIIVVNIILHRDKSKVFYFDGQNGYYVTDTDNEVFGSADGLTVIAGDDDCFLGYGKTGIYICQNGKVTTIEADNPSLVAYNESFSCVIYTENNMTMQWTLDGKKELGIEKDTNFTKACQVSDNGKYYVLTACETIEDVSAYTLFYGNYEGDIIPIETDENEKNIIDVCDDGSVVYLSMETAEYGIINNRNLYYYQDSITCIAENIDKVKLKADKSGIYYIDMAGKLYEADYSNITAPVKIDTEVTDFAVNELSDTEVYYMKEDGGYTFVKDEPVKIANTDLTSIVFYYNKDNDYLYFTDASSMYFVQKTGATGQKIFSLKDSAPIYRDKSLLALDDAGNIHKLTSGDEIILENVENIVEIEGSDGFAYTSNNAVYIRSEVDKKSKKAVDCKSCRQIAFSHKKYYILDDDNTFWEVSKKIKDTKSLGHIEFYIFIG